MKKADWMRELDAEFDAEERRRRAAHEESKRFMGEFVQAGLVDDVTPDGPIIPLPRLDVRCGVCGLVMDSEEFVDSHSAVCS